MSDGLYERWLDSRFPNPHDTQDLQLGDQIINDILNERHQQLDAALPDVSGLDMVMDKIQILHQQLVENRGKIIQFTILQGICIGPLALTCWSHIPKFCSLFPCGDRSIQGLTKAGSYTIDNNMPKHRLPSTSLWVPVDTSLGTTRTTSHVSYEKGIDSEFPSWHYCRLT